MPLRALCETGPILAPSLSYGEWEALRTRTRAGTSTLTLPCCGSRAFQRTSPRGVQHFYHAPDAGCEDGRETHDHLAAKLAIADGCQLAGFEPHLEWIDDGWRADVLAVRSGTRVAFEVQWSTQSLEETLDRQRRYAEADVRGCWLFRRPPPQLRRRSAGTPMMARQDLPAFLLPYDPDGTPRVYLNGRHYPLDRFVASLLTGDVRFRTRIRVPRWHAVDLLFFEVACPRCRGRSHVYCLDPPTATAACGVDVSRSTCPPTFRPAVRRAAWAFLISGEGTFLRLGSMGPRLLRGRERLCFGCFWCDAPFPATHLVEREEGVRQTGNWSAVLRTVLGTLGPGIIGRPHWCFPEDGRYCPRSSESRSLDTRLP